MKTIRTFVFSFYSYLHILKFSRIHFERVAYDAKWHNIREPVAICYSKNDSCMYCGSIVHSLLRASRSLNERWGAGGEAETKRLRKLNFVALRDDLN